MEQKIYLDFLFFSEFTNFDVSLPFIFPLSDIGDGDFNIETCRSLVSMYDVSLIMICTQFG